MYGKTKVKNIGLKCQILPPQFSAVVFLPAQKIKLASQVNSEKGDIKLGSKFVYYKNAIKVNALL